MYLNTESEVCALQNKFSGFYGIRFDILFSGAIAFYICKYENTLPWGPNNFAQAVFWHSFLKHQMVLRDTTNDDDLSHAYWFYLLLL